MSDTNIIKDPNNNTLIVERLFDAPRERVWQAWTDPAILADWWGPRGWVTTIKRFEFEPGGVWHYCMTCLDPDQGDMFEQESWGKATFMTIDAPKSFTYKDEFSDAEGKVDESAPAMEIYMEFDDDGDRTRLVSRSVFETAEGYQKVLDMGVIDGLTQTWDRLEEQLSGQPKPDPAAETPA